MRYSKMLGLAAVAAMALMAIVGAGSASATAKLCKVATSPCPAGQSYGVGTTLHFSLKPGTSVKVVTTDQKTTLNTCVKTTTHIDITVDNTPNGPITKLLWEECEFPTSTSILGGLKVDYLSGTNGTITANSEIGVTFNTIFFGSCVYGVKAGTKLGTLTGGSPASFDASAVFIKLSGSAFACPETAKWTATLVATEPSATLHVTNG